MMRSKMPNAAYSNRYLQCNSLVLDWKSRNYEGIVQSVDIVKLWRLKWLHFNQKLFYNVLKISDKVKFFLGQ